MTNYTDGTGKYYGPGSLITGDPSHQIVNVRSVSEYTSVTMPVATVTANIGSVWSVVPNLTDLGGGVWSNGLLVDPQQVQV